MSEAHALKLLKQGIASARAGEKSLAHRLLTRSAELDPSNDAVWLWLAVVAETRADKIEFLQRALGANPNNKRVRAMLRQLRIKHVEETNTWKCPLCMTPAAKPSNPCPSCGAVLSLQNLDTLFNSRVDHNKIERAVNGYKNVLGKGVDFGAHYNLALGYLNLNQTHRGVAHLQAALRLNPKDKALSSIVEELLRRQAASQAAASVNGSVAQPEARGLILAVDDSPTIRKLVSITLKRHDYDVEVAEDGMEALGMLNHLEPDLILLDITMPRMDGYQVCKVIKNNVETKHIPVVMLSGNDGFFDKVRGRLAGSTRYITKPFDPTILLQVVEKHALRDRVLEVA